MSRSKRFVTPENIEVTFELAGIGSRFIAAAIDLAIQITAILGAAVVCAVLTMGVTSLARAFRGDIPGWFWAAFTLWSFAVMFGYHTFFEMLWSGQTPGKRVAGLRVVRDGGQPIDIFASSVRNLVRIADLMPPPYGAGLISIFFSPDYKRLGDIAAGTLVIKQGSADELRAERLGPPSPMVAHMASLLQTVDEVTLEEFQAIRRFSARRYELDIPVQAHIAMRLALPILAKLPVQLPITAQIHYADALEAIARRYVEDRGVL